MSDERDVAMEIADVAVMTTLETELKHSAVVMIVRHALRQHDEELVRLKAERDALAKRLEAVNAHCKRHSGSVTLQEVLRLARGDPRPDAGGGRCNGVSMTDRTTDQSRRDRSDLGYARSVWR